MSYREFFGYTSICSYCVLEWLSVAFCHIKFQSTPSLILFTLTDDPQFYGLRVSLSNVLMIGLFHSNNRMVIFSKTEKKFISKQTRKGPYIYDAHMEEGWEGVSKFVTCLQIFYFFFFLTKDLLFIFADGGHKIGHF